MAASVSDDGLPEPPSPEWVWTVESGPADAMVVFDPSDEDPLVTVDRPGTYMLRLTANNSELENYDEVVLTATEVSCQYVIDNGLLYVGDVSGPEGKPDCRVNMYDLGFLAEYWLVQE